MTDRQTLYRHFDNAGELLYVGISSRISKRVKEHSKHSPWWLAIANIKLEHFDTREDVIEAERLAIQTERPKYNIHHTCTHLPERKPTEGKLQKETLVARVVTLKPLYKLPDAAMVMGVSTIFLRKEIAAKRLACVEKYVTDGAIKLTQYVSGWQLLDWLENFGAFNEPTGASDEDYT